MNQNNEKKRYYSLLTGPRRAVPIILCALGVFLAFCYFTASTGVLGGAVINALRGLFSYGAYAVAPLFILHGAFYPSDVAKKRVVSRIIFSVIAVISVAVMSYAVFYIGADIKPAFAPSDYYKMGTDGKGGGVIGSIIAYGIIKALGSVGLIIITAAVLAIYVVYFFKDGEGAFGKICLSVISFFANIGAFFERKIKSGFGKIKNAKTEKDKRISVAKSRDLSEDDFFMVDNGMSDFEIADLGIKETKGNEPEGAPVLHEKVRFKSSVGEEQTEKESLRNVRIIDEEEKEHEEAKAKPKERAERRRVLHTDFDLDEAVVPPAPAVKEDDIIYEESEKIITSKENSAESVFAKDFDPFDISMNEKLASKPSSKRAQSTIPKKETARFTEDISNITPEDVERARRQAEFDMKKRTLIESLAKKDEPEEPSAVEAAQSPAFEEKTAPVSNYQPSEPESAPKEETPSSSYILFDEPRGRAFDEIIPEKTEKSEEPAYYTPEPYAAEASPYTAPYTYREEPKTPSYEEKESPLLSDERPVFAEYREASESTAAPIYTASETSYTAPSYAQREPVSEASEPEAEYSLGKAEDEPSFNYNESVSDVITEYSTQRAAADSEKTVIIEEYRAPEPEATIASSKPEEEAALGDEYISIPEEQSTLTLEHERVIPSFDEMFAESAAEKADDTIEPTEELLAEGEDEDGAYEPEIIPKEERNPKVEEYRNMFPVLDEESDDNEEEDGLTFEHAEIPEPEPETDELLLPEEEDEPPFGTDDIINEDYDDEPVRAPEKKPEPPKPKKPDYSKYKFPPLDLLGIDEDAESEDVNAEIEENANNLISTLNDFRVKASIKGVDRGPRITRYEIVPATGVKVSSIMNLQDDIQLRLAAEGIRMEAPIPGKSAIGFELPNRHPSTVRLRSLLETEEFTSAKSKTFVCVGKDVAGCPVFGDIAKMPHMLIAGATGMGKSVCINSLMISMLYKAKPDEVKFIMIDPKKVEFNMYNGIPHLLIPVVTDPKQAAGALMWAVEQMEKRYELIEKARVRNADMYNEKVAKDPSVGEPMPKIVIVIDEFADLMLQVRDPVEGLVMSIAQKARAAGIHLVIGTQRPSVDVITGVIKANIPSRISCKVMSNTDSRTVLDQKGAEDLLDKGDMLFFPSGKPKPVRVQGAFVSDGEVEEIMEFIKSQTGDGNYDSEVMEEITRNAQKCNKKGSDDRDGDDGDDEDNQGFLNDQKFLDAVNVAVTTGKISTSLLQRKLSIGYGKAAKYVDTMEDMGIVSEPNGQKARDVLMTRDEWHEKLARLSLDD